MERRLRLVKVVVSATDDELEAITSRIGESICTPADHDGACPTPWTLVTTAVEDLDEPERSALVQLADS